MTAGSETLLIADRVAAYAAGSADPVADLHEAVKDLAALDHVVLYAVPTVENEERLTAALAKQAAGTPQPLLGIPFVIKDNIDLADAPTTAACPGYSYIAAESATVVQLLLDAGALPLAKVNLDQFATGLVGVRSPYGIPKNPVQPGKIPGGSSSGSAVAVAAGAVPFALGTDTAGSGRVPAAACNLIGLKPTKGRLSTRGVVPACRSLDCVSVFAENAADAALVAGIAGVYDAGDPFARPAPSGASLLLGSLGVLADDDLVIDDVDYAAAYQQVAELAVADGIETSVVSYAPLARAAALLYEGPWVAERTAAVGDFIDDNRDNADAGLDPTVSGIISGGRSGTATAAFTASYEMAEKRRQADQMWEHIDALLLPTVPGIPTVEAVLADPVALNSRLGTYTNFVNLLDCCGVTFPVGTPGKDLASVTLIAPAWKEDALLAAVARWHAQLATTVGASQRQVPKAAPMPLDAGHESERLVVVGAHRSGQPLHHTLLSRGAAYVATMTTAPAYELFALPKDASGMSKPAMVRATGPDAAEGAAITVEVYDLPRNQWGSFLATIHSPLGIGRIELADGTWVHGFLADSALVAASGAENITQHGDWLTYLETISES